MDPGIYEMPAADYHALTGMFSRSVGHTLIDATPLHAATPQDDASRAMDLGSAIHARLLGKGNAVVVHPDATDWRKKEPKAWRESARENGWIPLLPAESEAADRAVASARAYIAQVPELAEAFADGAAEQVLIWDAAGVRNRAMVDWLPGKNRRPLIDIKTTEAAINPNAWAQKAFRMGYDMQAAHYTEGARMLGREPTGFLFLVVEQKPPFACCVMGCAPSMQDLGQKRVRRARALWKRCTEEGDWPGFPPLVHWAEAPNWALMAEEDAAIRDEMTTGESKK